MSLLVNKHLPPTPRNFQRALPDQHDGLSTRNDHRMASSSILESTSSSRRCQLPQISRQKGDGHWWPWELLCELLAIGSLGAMVLTLWYYQDKPQAEWQQSYFTLNGLVAFLATLAKTGLIIPVSAAIGQRKWLRFLPDRKGNTRIRRLGDFEVFDEASRGSLGSAKLMISLNGRDIACLGAFVTIVSVFFNAITQNVLGTYESFQDGRPSGMQADRVPRAEIFNSTSQPRNSELTFQENYFTDVSTLAAIYKGIMSESVEDVPISCATGNCTWPVVPTIGMCGACIDMKEKLEYDCTGSSDSDSCYFSIPGGTNLTKPRSLYNYTETTPIFVAGPGSDYIFNRTDIIGKGGVLHKMSYNFIGQSYKDFVGANDGSWIPGNRTIFNRDNVFAYECGLWHCLQARSIKASNGVVSDTLADFRNGQNPREDQEKPDSWPLTWRYIDDPSFNVDNISAYDSYSGLSVDATSYTLDGALTGSVTITSGNIVSYTPTLMTFYGPHMRKETGLGSAADCLHAAWVYADDINAWWGRLAKSMTNNIRMNGYLQNEETDRYAGIAWTAIVYIEVRWLWLIFPGTLVLLSMIFLAATMVASRQSGLRPWKSFILPVLYTRLEEGLQEEWRQEFAQDSSLLSEVKDRWTALDNGDDNWIFRHGMKDSRKMREMRFAGDMSLEG